MHGLNAAADLGIDAVVVAMEGLSAGLLPDAQRVPEPGLHAVLPLAMRAAEAGNFADVALLDANYLRVPDAELHRLAAIAREGAALA